VGCSPEWLKGSIADSRSISWNSWAADVAARVNSIEYGASMVIWTEPMTTDKRTLDGQSKPESHRAWGLT
jgi:hypothetical protein